MKVKIEASRAAGTVAAPPSKSMAHRLLICAGLSEKKSTVKGIAPSADVLATLDCLKALGAEFTYEGETVVMEKGIDLEKTEKAVLNCNECGSTLRFFIPIALLADKEITLTGSPTLMKRPLLVYEDICKKEGFLFEKEGESLKVKGLLKAGTYEIQGNISSQFITGLLFALPLLKGDSVIKLIPPVESGSYINMTISALRQFGVEIERPDETTLCIKGGSTYEAEEVTVEGDYSNAAFFEALNIAGGDVKITNLREDSLQGDRVYKDNYKKIKENGGIIDISDCPDLGPVLFAAAAMCHGARFTGTKRLKIKESDRGAAMQQELSKFGIRMDCFDNDITVHDGELKKPEEILSGHNDHRIVMSLSVLCTLTGGQIDEAEAVRKSFPDFFERLKDLNIEVQTDGMDQ